MTIRIDIDRVSEILREVAATEVMSRWRQLADGDTTYKAGSGGPVTVADHAAEAALERRLTDLLPGSHVVGEEGVAADPARLDLLRREEPVWVLDPIDGTRAFAKGREAFDMMVALVVGGKPIAGWILHPVSGLLYAGERGGGVRLTDAAGNVNRPNRAPRSGIGDLVGLLRQDWPRSDPRRAIVTHANRLAGVVPLTSAGRNYVRMIAGEADFLINFSINAWDHLPGLLLISELGMNFGRVDGTPYHPAEQGAALLSAPANLWREVRDLLIDPLTASQGRS